MSVDCSKKFLTQFAQFSLLNPSNRLEKHGFKKNAFKVLVRDETWFS